MQVTVEKPGWISYVFSGDLTQARRAEIEEGIARADATIREQYRETGKPVHIIMDMNGFSDVYDLSTLKMFAEFAEKHGHDVAKTAGFGGSKQTQAAAGVLLAFTHRDNIRFFETKEEALAWLES